MNWTQLKDGILRDELPKDRTKYVRFTNLASINKKMVIYYLKAGFMNPTLRKPNSEIIQNQFTGSTWKPYITTVGLFDDQARLLAVAKLARPIQKREDIDMNFLIRWDY